MSTLHDQTEGLIDGPKEESAGQQYTPEQKKWILISCLTALCVGNMMMLNVAVFLPSYIENRNQ